MFGNDGLTVRSLTVRGPLLTPVKEDAMLPLMGLNVSFSLLWMENERCFGRRRWPAVEVVTVVEFDRRVEVQRATGAQYNALKLK